jgi:PAS domain S-box-containing protein
MKERFITLYYNKVYQNFPIAVFVADAKTGVLLDCNRQAEKMVGLPREKIVGMHQTSLHPREDEQYYRRLFRWAVKLKKPPKDIVRIVVNRRDGRRIPVIISGSLVELGNKKILMGAFQDISKWIEAETKYTQLYNSVVDGIVFVNMKGRILDCNPAYCSMLGYTKEELLKLSYQRLTPKKWHKMERKIVEDLIIKKGYSQEYEKEYIRKDGKVFPVSLRIWLIKDKKGKPSGMWGVVRDISERRRAQAALERERQQMDNILSAMNAGLAIVNQDMRISWVNNKLRELFPDKEPIGQLCYNFYESRKRPCRPWPCATKKAFLTGKVHEMEKFNSANGRWYHIISQPIKDESGEVLQVLETILDATDARLAQERLRMSQERYRNTLDNMLEGCQIIGYDWRYLYVNRTLCRQWRKSKKELLGKTMIEAYPGIEKTELFSALRRCMKKRVSHKMENEFTYPDGSRAWFDLSIQPVPEGLFILSVDITGRKKAEDTLRLERERFKLIYEHSPNAILLVDKDYRVIFANRTVEKITGVAISRLKGRRCFDAIMGRARVCDTCKIEETIRTKEVQAQIKHEVTAAGKENWIEQLWYPVFDKKGDVDLVVEIATDITERKRAEEAIRKSQERFQIVSQATNDAVWDWDLAGDTVLWNEAVATLFGYSIDNNTTDLKWWEERLHPEDRQRVVSGLYSDINSGKHIWSDEYRFRRKDNSYAYVIDRGFVIRDKKGKPVRMIGSMMDITGRKRAEEAVLREKRRYEELVNSLNVGVFRTTAEPKGRFLEANPAMVSMFEAGSKGELLKHSPAETYKDPKRRKEFVDKMMRFGSVKNEEIELITLKGRRFWGSVTAVKKEDEAGRVYFEGIVEEITERKKWEEELERQLKIRTAQLEEAYEKLRRSEKLSAVGKICGIISHELRNPLGSIRNAAYFLKMKLKASKFKDERIERHLEIIESESLACAKIISETLDFTRLKIPSLAKVNINDILRQALEQAGIPESVEVALKLKKGLAEVQGDPVHLGRAFLNIIKNAVEAMPEGGRLAITTESKNGFLEVQIKDTGVGISKEALQEIFEPLFSTKPDGTGLGLSICKEIIEQHGGDIGVASKLGKGSIFFVRLPLKKDPGGEMQDEEKRF